ncbi:MAG: UDP-N-acetylmuramoyl-L-alanyl-D-glutamate--2,6-diaminopimelate ligase [Oscillatoriales cyanobacterium SM2_2_1]|nr:UDP-N-acetylmuramoyl-L-alanyl-D-glutamate--2,6-diaminopimelate ligase [Oscillatoriales cyanobacterium SM2_2_1]
MELHELWQRAGLGTPQCSGAVARLVTDSREVTAGDLFIGLPGTQVNGADFVPVALTRGAIAAVVDQSMVAAVRAASGADAPRVLAADDILIACGDLATAFYDYPAQHLRMVGVTGTNGKTTITHLIEFLMQEAISTALLGTLYTRWPGYCVSASHTTPFAVSLQSHLAAAVAAGVKVAVMEVSSHGLSQERVRGCRFEVAVFSNLTQDHLDFHGTMEHYFAAKAKLFMPEYLKGRAILNGDDPYGQKLRDQIGDQSVWCYQLYDERADFFVEDLTLTPSGVTGTVHTPAGPLALCSPLVGQFNVQNVLAAIAAAMALGLDRETIATRLPLFPNVPGRMEQVVVDGQQDLTVVVDYAHTPDGLENVLRSLRPFTRQKLICVFGCGGDRDRRKRPLMGSIAARLSDHTYVTSDNPRTEDPQQILQDILAGIPPQTSPVVQGDRRAAIRQAILNAAPGDVVVIAGKGHEDYQILGHQKIHFDDRQEARVALQQRYGQYSKRDEIDVK